MSSFTARLVPNHFKLESASIVDANYDFPLSNDFSPRSTNIVEYFYFVDIAGTVAPATAGNVAIVGSPDGGITWQTLNDASFNAAASELPTRVKPSGRGRVTHLRITLSGVVAAGAVGFSSLLTQEL